MKRLNDEMIVKISNIVAEDTAKEYKKDFEKVNCCLPDEIEETIIQISSSVAARAVANSLRLIKIFLNED